MLEAAATVTVLAAQKGAAYVARGTVVVGGGIERYQRAPCSGHCALRSELFAKHYEFDRLVSIQFMGVHELLNPVKAGMVENAWDYR